MALCQVGKAIILFCLCWALAGCQTQTARKDTAVQAIDAALTATDVPGPTTAPPPAAVREALLPPIVVDTRVEQEPGQQFQISVHESPAAEFFMSLVDGTDYNMVLHPGVSGLITLNLKNVTIPDVMDVVRNVYGYEFQRTTYGFEVLPARLRSAVFQVDFLNVLRSGVSQTRVSSGQISQAGQSSGSGSEDTDTETAQSENSSLSGTRILTQQPVTSYWTELQNSLTAIVGDNEGRSVIVNPQSGTVVVRAMPRELRDVKALLDATQEIAHRQVILEAKILEVELNDQYRQGINWSGVVAAGEETATGSQIGGGSILDGGTSLIKNTGFSNVGNLDPSAFVPLIGAATGAFGGMFTLALALSDFTAFIELLDSQGTVHVLSSPRVATMNNQKAVIKVGQDEFFVTDISTTTVTGTTTTSSPSVELTPFFSGIALDVTPQISKNGEVLLHVHPSVSEVVDQEKTITIGNISQTLPLAMSTVRESDSIIRASDGQVVVIGGLMQDSVNDGTSKTPGLGDISGIGGLFRHENERIRKTELVILLKPTIVKSGQQWADTMRAAKQRISAINRYRDNSGSE